MGINVCGINSKNQLHLSVVDNCLIIGFPNVNDCFMETSYLTDAVKELTDAILPSTFNKIIVDLRNVEILYNDVIEIVEDAFPDNIVFAVNSQEQSEDLRLDRYGEFLVSPNLHTNPLVVPVEFSHFIRWYIDDPWYFIQYNDGDPNGFLKMYPEWNTFLPSFLTNQLRNVLDAAKNKVTSRVQSGHLDNFEQYSENIVRDSINATTSYYFDQLRCQSPLIQMALTVDESKIGCSLYHTGAVYRTSEGKEIFLTRPAIIAKSTNLVLNSKIKIFEDLINDPSVREDDLQDFFESNPNFLLGSEYQALYPQIRLLRDGDDPLIPDFFLQPASLYNWADILDLKLPTEKLVVGTKNRRRLSSAVQQGIAQLREYSRYFDNSDNRDKVFNTLKINCYSPKMILVIGRHTPEMDHFNIRRELSTYAHIDIKTYDELLEHAKRRLLL